VTIGPVEYMIVAFPGNKFKGEIIPALEDLVKSETIRIIDLAFIIKDAEGNVVSLEVGDLDSQVFQAFDALDAKPGGLLSEDDLITAAEGLQPDSSAALLVWEDVWATRFTEAVRDADGVLLDLARVPHEVVQAAVDWAAQQ
jgi:hypothetical protein